MIGRVSIRRECRARDLRGGLPSADGAQGRVRLRHPVRQRRRARGRRLPPRHRGRRRQRRVDRRRDRPRPPTPHGRVGHDHPPAGHRGGAQATADAIRHPAGWPASRGRPLRRPLASDRGWPRHVPRAAAATHHRPPEPRGVPSSLRAGHGVPDRARSRWSRTRARTSTARSTDSPTGRTWRVSTSLAWRTCPPIVIRATGMTGRAVDRPLVEAALAGTDARGRPSSSRPAGATPTGVRSRISTGTRS